MSIHDNDDDLFDYDPDEEVAASPTLSATVVDHEAEADKNNRFIKDIKENYEENGSSDALIDNDKVRLAIAFDRAYHHFITEINSESTKKAIYVALNTLTNGDFHLLKFFYMVEMRISRRMYFLELSERAFFPENSDESIFKALNDMFHFDFSEFYIKTSYTSSVNMCKHALALDRAQYISLSDKLGIPVKQELFEPYNLPDAANTPHTVYLQDYIYEKDSELKVQMISELNLMDNLNAMLNHPMELVHFDEEKA